MQSFHRHQYQYLGPGFTEIDMDIFLLEDAFKNSKKGYGITPKPHVGLH